MDNCLVLLSRLLKKMCYNNDSIGTVSENELKSKCLLRCYEKSKLTVLTSSNKRFKNCDLELNKNEDKFLKSNDTVNQNSVVDDDKLLNFIDLPCRTERTKFSANENLKRFTYHNSNRIDSCRRTFNLLTAFFTFTNHVFVRIVLLLNIFQWMALEKVSASNSPLPCPLQCICLSQAQVLCNTGGLTDVPVSALPPTVEHLSLTKNNFPLIRSDAFNGLRNLRKLSLDGNNITVIRPFAFRGLPRLRELSIQHTPLTVITQFAFAALQNITAILLGHNKIHKIEGYAFAGTSNVRLLLLNSNPLHKIETSAFSGLTNVEHLILPSGIKNIEPDAFSGLDSVGLIKLSFMDLTALKAHTFRGLTHVHVLSVQESDLGIIKPNAFLGMAHVNSLNLLNNKIDSIQELHILQDAKVKMLRLHGNHLLENPLPGAIVLEGVETLNVTANHFPCDCHLHVLMEGPLANGSTSEFSAKNFCISPIYYNGKAISSVNMKTIGRCSEDLTRETWDALPSKSGICKISLYSIAFLIVFFISR